MKRITIVLSNDDMQRLRALSEREYRDVRQQAGRMLAEALKERERETERATCQ